MIMVPTTQASTSNPTGTKLRRPRSSVLLASAAGIGLALVLAGPGAYNQLGAGTTAAHAAEAAQPAPNFADLVAKVKPAVISVRVKMAQTASTTGMGENEDNNVSPLQPGLPFERFFRQFEFRGTPG